MVRPVKIASLATYVPPRVLTNADLEKMVETSNEWILQRTGIHERHIADPGVGTSDLAKEAALCAIKQAGLTPADIGFIVVGTTTPDMIFPSTACLLQHKIGASRAWGFDLGAACSGFTYALTTGHQMVATGAHDHALVVGADVMSSIIDYTDRATCVLFGDGAGRGTVARDGWRARIIDFLHESTAAAAPALHAGGRQPAARVARDGGRAAPLRQAGRAGGLQVRRAQDRGDQPPADGEDRHRPEGRDLSSRTRRTSRIIRPRPTGSGSINKVVITSSTTATRPPGRSRSRSPTRSRRAG